MSSYGDGREALIMRYLERVAGRTVIHVDQMVEAGSVVVADVSYAILPAVPRTRGPQIVVEGKPHTVPDFLISEADGSQWWADSKGKRQWTWYKRGMRIETGINLRHWDAYRAVSKATGVPCILLFAHTDKTVDWYGCMERVHLVPEPGLYGVKLHNGGLWTSHVYDWGVGPYAENMVYWTPCRDPALEWGLHLLAPLEELESAAA